MPWATQEAQLEALEAARAAVREDASNAGHADLVALARAQGCAKPHAQTLLAIIAVLDHLEHPAKFTCDRAAYDEHGAKQTTFKLWKGRISHLMSAQLVNEEVELSPEDELTITGVMEMAAATDRVYGAMLPDSPGGQKVSGARGSTSLRGSDAGGTSSGDAGAPGEESEEGASAVAVGGGLEVAEAMMRAHPVNLGVQMVGCATLCSLDGDAMSMLEVDAVGGLEVVVAAMWAHPGDLHIQRNGCLTLGAVAGDNAACKQVVAAAGGLEVAVAAVRAHPSDLTIQAPDFETLYRVSSK